MQRTNTFGIVLGFIPNGTALSPTYVVDCPLVIDALSARDEDEVLRSLAEALGCELLTGDVKLKNATGHHATVIVSR
jgi:hypothetical protein